MSEVNQVVSLFYKRDKTYILEPLTDERIHHAEQMLKVKLPEEYIGLLKEQNGGHIKYHSYPIYSDEGVLQDKVSIDYLMGISDNDDEGILQTPYFIDEWELPRNIVLLSGDGHSWIALDYRNTGINPPVILLETEDEAVIPLASSFSDFLHQLIMTNKAQKRSKKMLFTDIKMNVKIKRKHLEMSSLSIIFKGENQEGYSFQEDIFETFHPNYELNKSLFIKQLEDMEEELKNDRFGNNNQIGINGYNDELIIKYDKKDNRIIIKENRRTIGYFSDLGLFLSLFYKRLSLVLKEIEETNLSKGFKIQK